MAEKHNNFTPIYKKNKSEEEINLLQRNGKPAHTVNHELKKTNVYDREMEVIYPDNRDALMVSVSPGWDGMNYPDEILNFKKQPDIPPPPDRWRIVYIVMLFNGVAVLMPWNMFITAKAYFEDYKLNVNGSHTEYRHFFMNYLGITSQLPNALMSLANVACHCGLSSGRNIRRRMLSTTFIGILVFVVTVILAIVDTSAWPFEFFWVTMISVVIINSANGIFQTCAYGIAAKLPMKYTNAVILGSNLSGTLTALVGIISIAASPNLRIAAIYYFITAIVVLAITLDCVFILPITKYYRYYDALSSIEDKIDSDSVKLQKHGPPFKKVFKRIWMQMFNVWFVFFITLGLFPAIQADIRPVDPDFPIPPMYWAPVFCFLSFNLFAVSGNFISGFIKFPNSRFLWIPVLLRGLIFVPFFMLCNYRPDIRDLLKFPVIISNDWGYIVGSAFNSLLSGYLSSLAMMYAPTLVPPHLAATAGMMMGCTLCFGVFSGTLLSLALAKIYTEFGTIPFS